MLHYPVLMLSAKYLSSWFGSTFVGLQRNCFILSNKIPLHWGLESQIKWASWNRNKKNREKGQKFSVSFLNKCDFKYVFQDIEFSFVEGTIEAVATLFNMNLDTGIIKRCQHKLRHAKTSLVQTNPSSTMITTDIGNATSPAILTHLLSGFEHLQPWLFSELNWIEESNFRWNRRKFRVCKIPIGTAACRDLCAKMSNCTQES